MDYTENFGYEFISLTFCINIVGWNFYNQEIRKKTPVEILSEFLEELRNTGAIH